MLQNQRTYRMANSRVDHRAFSAFVFALAGAFEYNLGNMARQNHLLALLFPSRSFGVGYSFINLSPPLSQIQNTLY